MIEFLSSSLAKFFFVPLITIIVGLFIKVSSVNDKYKTDTKEWFFLGPDLISAGLLIVFVELCNSLQLSNAVEGNNSGVVSALVLCFLSILLMPFWIRKTGYEEQPIMHGFSHHFWRGIIIPDIWGLAVLFFILKFIGQ